jgi:hypothetical protein
MLGWRLESKGDNAARELLASMDLVRGVAGGRPFVPAKLRIVERRGNANGQAVRYVVPVIDVSVRYAEILGGEQSRERAALPAGYTPIEQRPTNGATLAEGLREAETQTLAKPPRVQLAEDDEILDESGAPASPPAEPTAAEPNGAPATHAENIAALDALVGSMRDAGIVNTRQVWVRMARLRNIAVDDMIELLKGVGEDGELHWSPLRDSLDEAEAAELRRRLGRFWAENMPAGATA